MKRSAAEGGPDPAAWAWGGVLLALALVPDEKLLRWKLLAVQAGLALLWAVPVAARLSGRPVPRPRGPLDLPVLLYALSGLVFFALSPEPRGSESELVRVLGSCAAYFLAFGGFAAMRRPEPALGAWALGAGLCGLLAMASREARPMSGFGNPIFMGTFLAASLVLTAGLLAASPSGAGRSLLAAAGLAQAAGLWRSQSRAALGGLVGAGLLWAALRLRGRARRAALGGLAAAGALLLWHFWGRRWTHGLIWEGAWSLFLEHPLLGSGLGRFHLEFPAHAPPALRALWPQSATIVNFAHNEYLQVACETGLLGLAAFAAVPLSALGALARSRSGPLADAAALAALTFFAAAFFSPDLRFGVSSLAAFSALGAFSALSREGREAPLGLPAALAAAGLLGLWAVLAARPALAVRALLSAPEFHSSDPGTAETLSRLERELAARPEDADLAERLGYLYAKERAWAQAASRYELASRLAPHRPGPHNNLGNLRYLAGDLPGAALSWERSLAADPGQLDARLNLGKALYERGRLKEAARHLEKVLERDPGNEKARVLLKRMLE